MTIALLDTATLVAVTAMLVAGVRSLIPRIDGRALVLVCSLLLGVGASWLVGGEPTVRALVMRGLLAGFGAFSAASGYQWAAAKLPGASSVGRWGPRP